MAIDTPNKDYNSMKEFGEWDMLTALNGGTRAMRKAGKTYLPQETDEPDPKYTTRLNRSFLYNAYKDTITKCVSRPFSKPMVIKLPEALMPLVENFDGEGQHMQDFGMEYFKELVSWGVAHAYADYPTVADPKKENKKTVKQKGLFPFNKIIPTKRMIGWQVGEKKKNEKELKQIRYEKTKTYDIESYQQEVRKQIWIVEKDKFEVWEFKSVENKEQWVKVDSGTIQNSIDGIPLVTAYTEKEKMMVAYPPLVELGWTNVEHWQSLSDQKNILRFCRFGILMASGFNKAEIKQGLTVAPTQVVYSENPDAKLSFIEHTGKAVEAGNTDIKSIEDRMEVLGLQPMLQKYWNVKATGQAINEKKSVSQIEMWITATIRAMKQLIIYDAQWMGINDLTEDDIKIEINKEFVFGSADSSDIQALHKARELGDIDQNTYLMELKRFGVLSDDVDVDNTIRLSRIEEPVVQGFTNNEGTGADGVLSGNAQEFVEAEGGEEL